VVESYSGKWLGPQANFSLHCPPGEDLVFDITSAISDRTLKLLALMSGLFVFLSIYYSIEMAFCTADEKISFEGDDTAFLDVDQLSTNSQSDHIISHATPQGTNVSEKILSEKT
jgi:proprotein convertase subtilisin/kexin type 7